MISSMIVSIVFRLINFALLIFALVYIYKKYIRDFLVKGLQQEHEALKSLELQKKDTIDQSETLKKQLHDDQVLIQQLKKKIAQWAHAEKMWKQECAAYKQHCIEKLKKQSDFKQLRIAEYMLEKESISLIIDRSRDELIKQFDDTKSYQYVQSILEPLAKKSVLS